MNKYFLGEATQNGFKTDFGKIMYSDDFYTYILKGGAGTGKSTLMKKIAEEFENDDMIDEYFCSSDTNSLDAVVLNKRKIIVVDGTSPHTFDPMYAGVMQSIVNLGECWNSDNLKKNKKEIIDVCNENAEWHKRCRRYITALSSLNSDIYSIAGNSLKLEKLNGFAERFVKKNIVPKKSEIGKSILKKMSAITQQGYFTQQISAGKVFVIADRYFAGGDAFLRKLEEMSVARGYEVIVSTSNMFNNIVYEHVLIPEIDTAFISSTPLNKISAVGTKINFDRFYSKEKIREKKKRLDFSKRAADELAEEAAYSLENAKSVHDVIESYYISSVDFDKVNDITNEIISEIRLA